jgi:hypothetical protein
MMAGSGLLFGNLCVLESSNWALRCSSTKYTINLNVELTFIRIGVRRYEMHPFLITGIRLLPAD